MQKRATQRVGFKYAKSKIRGSYGDTDLKTKRIRVNTALIKKDKGKGIAKTGFSKKDLTKINILVHETLHAKHPKMHEKTVRRRARAKVSKMSRQAKQRMYNKLK